jgi:hypothetical protein
MNKLINNITAAIKIKNAMTAWFKGRLFKYLNTN